MLELAAPMGFFFTAAGAGAVAGAAAFSGALAFMLNPAKSPARPPPPPKASSSNGEDTGAVGAGTGGAGAGGAAGPPIGSQNVDFASSFIV